MSQGEYTDFIFTSFFIKGKPNTKRITKRKFVFFGPIIYDETIQVDNFVKCFELGVNLSEGSIVDPDIIREAEEKFNRKIIITDKEITI
jgi:hypothetical protein